MINIAALAAPAAIPPFAPGERLEVFDSLFVIGVLVVGMLVVKTLVNRTLVV